MSWPRVRGSPAPRRVSACRVRAAYMATPWRDGEQGGEVAHGVRGRAEADVPFGGGVAGPLGDGARVPAVGGGPGRGDDAPVPGAVERPGVGGEFGVDGGPVLRGQARGFLHQQGGAPFVELPGLQRGEGVGHFGDEGFGQAQEPAALAGDSRRARAICAPTPAPSSAAGIPAVGLFAALEQVERDGQTRLTGRQGGFLRLPGHRISAISPPARPRSGPDSRQRPGHLHDRHACRTRLLQPAEMRRAPARRP